VSRQRVLGEGVTGVVYAATNDRSEAVAIKFLCETCLDQCKSVVADAIGRAMSRAVAGCVTRVVDSRGAEAADCPAIGTAAPSADDRVACATKCRDQAAQILALQPPGARAAQTAPAPPQPSHATPTTRSGSRGMALCLTSITFSLRWGDVIVAQQPFAATGSPPPPAYALATGGAVLTMAAFVAVHSSVPGTAPAGRRG
jgi:hypothetical protein